ncbi:STAS domain-containing protein [Sporosarcina saromensis]|uniref:STAS domain-containing protein n=1 Tax=Sporosarcina saromensis TaxID=359365 RepID=A0ABU4G7U8_9BACL|nr:STAS domain-containing protein [Sporosarcina saromensis]MDW0113044.1 STAS domain-containing protein [Sporosarcina saromensis]
MSFPNSAFPLPMYAINQHLEIVQMNQAALNTLTIGTSLLDIIESESRSKLAEHLEQFQTIKALEINLLTKTSDIQLADLYVSWTDETIGEVIIVPKDEAVRKVSEQLGRLRHRLTETNFELLQAKESAEELLQENIRLSSPFIELTQTVGLIPIFGPLDEQKSENIAATVSNRAYKSDADTVIIDFTAVGEIEQGGLNGFQKLVHIMQLLGFTMLVVGLHPEHVKKWSALEFTADVRFLKSLRLALDSVLTTPVR